MQTKRLKYYATFLLTSPPHKWVKVTGRVWGPSWVSYFNNLRQILNARKDEMGWMLNHFLLLLCWLRLPGIILQLLCLSGSLTPYYLQLERLAYFPAFFNPFSPQSNPIILLQLELLPLRRLWHILSLPLLLFRKLVLWISGCYRHFSECM